MTSAIASRVGISYKDKEVMASLELSGITLDSIARNLPGYHTGYTCSQCGTPVMSDEERDCQILCLRCMGWSPDKGTVMEFLKGMYEKHGAIPLSALNRMVQVLEDESANDQDRERTANMFTYAIHDTLFSDYPVDLDEPLTDTAKQALQTILQALLAENPEYATDLRVSTLDQMLTHH